MTPTGVCINLQIYPTNTRRPPRLFLCELSGLSGKLNGDLISPDISPHLPTFRLLLPDDHCPFTIHPIVLHKIQKII